MYNRHIIISILLTMFLSFSMETAQAFNWFEFNLGAGIYRYSNIRSNNKKEFLDKNPIYEPIPTFQVRLGPLFINKDGGGMALLYFKKVKLIGLVLYEGEPYKAYGMEERKKSFYLGGGLRIFDIEALYYQDLQSRSNGRVVKIIYAPEFVKNNYTFSPRAYVQHWDKKYTDYFFGVRSEEVDLSIGRYKYDGKRTLNYGLMLRNIWQVGQMKYVLSAGYKFYGSRVYNSPTVVKKEEQRIILGFMYKFF